MRIPSQVQTEVDADGHEDMDRMKLAAALSGGETSFTGICLLLAIWSNVQCPLRCLDEFDVFMDAANRLRAMTTLVGK